MILDVGCGSKPKGHVNIDLWSSKVADPKKHHTVEPKKIPNFILASAEHIPIRDNTFTIVHSAGLLEHCTNPHKAIKEFKRVSKNIVYIQVPDGAGSLDKTPYHLYSWNMKSLRNLLKLQFPKVEVHSTEKTAYKLQNKPVPLKFAGDLLLRFMRTTHSRLFCRRKLIAICYKE